MIHSLTEELDAVGARGVFLARRRPNKLLAKKKNNVSVRIIDPADSDMTTVIERKVHPDDFHQDVLQVLLESNFNSAASPPDIDLTNFQGECAWSYAHVKLKTKKSESVFIAVPYWQPSDGVFHLRLRVLYHPLILPLMTPLLNKRAHELTAMLLLSAFDAQTITTDNEVIFLTPRVS